MWNDDFPPIKIIILVSFKFLNMHQTFIRLKVLEHFKLLSS